MPFIADLTHYYYIAIVRLYENRAAEGHDLL